jgi:hypothetical protein
MPRKLTKLSLNDSRGANDIKCSRNLDKAGIDPFYKGNRREEKRRKRMNKTEKNV